MGGGEGGGSLNAILGMQNAEQCSVFHCEVLDTA